MRIISLINICCKKLEHPRLALFRKFSIFISFWTHAFLVQKKKYKNEGAIKLFEEENEEAKMHESRRKCKPKNERLKMTN